MKDFLWGLFLLIAVVGNAFAGQGVANYYVDDRWGSGTSENDLPHYQTPGEGCIAVLRRHMQIDQAQHIGLAYRYRFFQVGPYDEFGYGCGGVVETYTSGHWVTVETFDAQDDAVYPIFSSQNCSSGTADPNNGQCFPPKCTVCSCSGSCTNGTSNNPNTPPVVGNPIDAGSGNKHQTETDYVGAGAYPLRFERSYDSSRTWLNNPTPIGIGWTHNYLASLVLTAVEGSNTITQAIAYRPNGSIHLFNLVAGVWTPDADIAEHLTVSFDSDGVPSAALTTPDDTVERYDGKGRLISMTNRDGLTQTLSYSIGSNNYSTLQQVSDPQGHTLTFGYNTNGQLNSITDGNGAVIQYGYDVNGNLLTSVVYPDADGTTKTRNYLYNETNQVAGPWPYSLTGISEEITTGNFQRFASWGYDSLGRATFSVHGDYASGLIDKTSLIFNSNGTTQFTDALGQQRTYTFNVKYLVPHAGTLDTACDGCSAHDKARTYDANGYPTSSTDFNGNKTNFTFGAVDANGHPRGLETVRTEGIPPTGSTDLSARRYIATTWDPVFNVPAIQNIKDYSGSSPVSIQITKWIYNSRGQVTFRCLVDPTVSGATGYSCGSNPGNAPAGVRQWAWTYCEQSDVNAGTCPLVGLTLTAIGPRTDVTEKTAYAYYPTTDLSGCATGGVCHYLGDLLTVTAQTSATTSLTTTYVSYDGNGRPTRILDNNGVPTDLTYHPRGWLTQRVVRNAAAGTSTNDRITTWTYDGAGQVTQLVQPAGDFLTLGYDGAHRLTDVTNKFGEHVHFVLDNAGNRQEEDYYNASNVIKHKVLRDYSTLGRLTDVKNAKSGIPALAMTYLYDGNGNETQATDGRNYITINTYDPRNRLVKTEQDAAPGGLNIFTNYAYDNLDHLRTVVDPQGLQTQYTVDALGNRTQLDSRDTGTTTYTYDRAGNRTGQTDQRTPAVTATYTYDALNRLTGILYPAHPALNAGFAWDTRATGCASTYNFGQGRLAQVTDGSGSTQLCYDRYGETAKRIQTTGAAAPFTLAYVYDKDANPNNVTLPDGTVVAYTRDTAERIHTVKYKLSGQTAYTPVVNAVTFYPFGPINKITYGNARALTRTYDLDYVISQLADPASDGLNLTIQRDAVKNLTQITSGTDGNIFAYDGVNRLTGVTDLSSNPIWTYTYDGTGNRLSVQQGTSTPIPYTYPPGPTPPATHRLMAVGTTMRDYDGIGNTLDIGAGTAGALGFGYDDTGRMTQVTTGPSNTTAMQYLTNAYGQRVEKYLTSNSSLTQYQIRDSAGRLTSEFDGNNNRIRETLWMGDLPVGLLSGAGAAPTLSYIEADHLGTPRVAIDSTSNVGVWHWPILGDPFGQTQPTNLNGSSLVLNLRFQGQEYDSESAMDYNYFRDYEPSTGRYLESDPVGLDAGVSTYTYVNSSPLEYLDPLGLGKICGSGLFNFAVPDKPFGFAFASCCSDHDDCYGCKGKLAGAAKTDCDKGLQSCLHSKCDQYNAAVKLACNRTAGLYYEAVKHLGGRYFNKGRQEPCCTDPSGATDTGPGERD